MRILVENGCRAHLRNMGDIAMLEVSIRRLRTFWPNCQLEIVTRRPDEVPVHFRAGTIDPLVICEVEFSRVLPIKRAWLTPRTAAYVQTLEHHIRKRAPRPVKWLTSLWSSFRVRDRDRAAARLRYMAGIDAVVVTGGGFLTDEFPSTVRQVLANIELAQWLGKPVFLFSQGIGPVGDPELLDLMANAMTKPQLIALREGRTGPLLLRRLGVESDRITVTGDDAIELAFEAKREQIGDGLGVNLRIAPYSLVDDIVVGMVRKSLLKFMERHGVVLHAIPITWTDHETSDVRSLQRLLGEAGQSASWPQSATPLDVIREISKCRLVVTGSYHAGVFALSQGIPVVCIANSQYYLDKFYGLAEQFGVGCRVLRADKAGFPERLRVALSTTWEQGATVRDELLLAAAKQIQRSRAAYARCHAVMLETGVS